MTVVSAPLRTLRWGSQAIKLLLWVTLALVMLFPFYWGLVTSFKPPTELTVFPPIFWPHQFSALPNYKKVLDDIPMARFFLNSIYVASVSTVAVLFTSSLGGYIFEKFTFKGKELLFMGIVATMMVPFPVRVIPVYLLFKELRLLDTLPGLYVGALMSAYGIFLMRQFMKGIPSELLQAARIDGSSEFAIYARIVLPLCKPALSALAIFHFMSEWNSFLWPLLIIDNVNRRTIPLGIASYRHGFGMLEWNKIMACAMMAMIPVVVVFLMGQKQFIEGITLTGLKG
jgi:multiple sugar transport system permease protein